jgi:Na+/H+-dicarboxylate symporter
MNAKKESRLSLYIGAAIVLAVVLSLAAPHVAMKFHVGGEIFLRLLKMMVVPLVVTSVMSGINQLGDVRKLGRPGATAIGYYLSTTMLAVCVGLVMVNLIQPGVGAFDAESLSSLKSTERAAQAGDASVGTIVENLVLMLVTDNLFSAAVEANLLPLIVFSIIFAAMLTTLGSRVSGLKDMIDQSAHALLHFVQLLMKLAPIGVFCLVTARFGKAHASGHFLDELSQMAWYMLAVVLGLAVHSLVTLSLILWVTTKRNPYRFIQQMSPALLMAFSTASSSGTLPVTLETAQDRAGVSPRATDLVLPIGATINMDGTALYEAVAAIFIAQAIGVDLGFGAQVTVALTATLAAIGAAGIPEAGLVTMLIVLNAVGLPTEYIGLILSVDWLLDRFRTTVNVLGDAMGAAVVERALPALGDPTTPTVAPA